MEDHRISVQTKKVDISLSNGETISGEIFLQLHGSKSYGLQKIGEILNGEDAFIPVRHGNKTELINLCHIISLSCDSTEEIDELQALGHHYVVSVETPNKTFHNLHVYVNLPTDHERIKDFLNQNRIFFLFLSNDKALYLRRDKIIKVTDQD